jgi:hypothetical protein
MDLNLGGRQIYRGVYSAADPVYGSFFSGTGSLFVLRIQAGDFDADGDVDWADLRAMTVAMSGAGAIPAGGASAVPEPASVSLLLCGIGAALGGRRRRQSRNRIRNRRSGSILEE